MEDRYRQDMATAVDLYSVIYIPIERGLIDLLKLNWIPECMSKAFGMREAVRLTINQMGDRYGQGRGYCRRFV